MMYMGSEVIAPTLLTSALDGGEWLVSRLGRFTPGERALVSIGYEAEWAPELAWALWRREKSCLCRDPNPAVHPVARRYTPEVSRLFS
jgi:hypothetical protein